MYIWYALVQFLNFFVWYFTTDFIILESINHSITDFFYQCPKYLCPHYWQK
jgi:hypothetical protein